MSDIDDKVKHFPARSVLPPHLLQNIARDFADELHEVIVFGRLQSGELITFSSSESAEFLAVAALSLDETAKDVIAGRAALITE